MILSRIQTAWTSAAVLACALIATPAMAQTGGVRGRIVDDQQKPVAGATILLTYLGQVDRQISLTSDAKGEYIRVGIPPGNWKITVTKDKLSGAIPSLTVAIGDVQKQPDIVIKAGSAAAMSAKDVENFNKKQKENEAKFNDAKAAIEAGSFDDAVAKMDELITLLPECDACYTLRGDALLKKGDLDKAEAAYKKAIELKPDKPGPYASLATIYNQQKKFDDATKMSAKANELMSAGGATGDANSIYNQGVILWNQGKAEESEPLFLKATELDPKMSDAFYLLGMTRVNQGKLKEAVAPLEEYLKIDPSGKHVAEVKDLLKAIK